MSSCDGRVSSSSRRPMTRKYRKTLQEQEEVETAAPENKQLTSYVFQVPFLFISSLIHPFFMVFIALIVLSILGCWICH